jgi:hypothetical protein
MHISPIKGEFLETTNGFEELDRETVSPQFFDYLIVNFTEVAGPMAHRIVRDEAARLGESFESFPKKRVKHLIDNISLAIPNEILRNEFQKKMSVNVKACEPC